MSDKKYKIICPKHRPPAISFAKEPVCQECGRPADVVIPKLEERKRNEILQAHQQAKHNL